MSLSSQAAVDVIILSNGPGEVTTWVKPVAAALRTQVPSSDDLRISVVLSPCPNATGQEGAIAQEYPEVDRVQDAQHFVSFLLWGKTAANWDWHDRGVVLFLGGDQIYPVIVGKRLGYPTVVYAEWFANWPRWIDAFGLMNPRLLDQMSPAFRYKARVVGDLMNDGQTERSAIHASVSDRLKLAEGNELIGLLPGSKRAKLTQGVPLAIATADYIHQQRPQARFVIPVAPTIDVQTLVEYAALDTNPFVSVFGCPATQLIYPQHPDALPYLKTEAGTHIALWQPFPAHAVTRRCQLCLTTVGANTAELGSLGTPMIVLLPTQQLDAMNAWDGLLGLLINLPGVGRPLNKLVNWAFFTYLKRRQKLFAWPNIWAGQEIVPELLGPLTAEQVGDTVLGYLHHPQKLQHMRHQLHQVRGEPGAADKLSELVLHQIR